MFWINVFTGQLYNFITNIFVTQGTRVPGYVTGRYPFLVGYSLFLCSVSGTRFYEVPFQQDGQTFSSREFKLNLNFYVALNKIKIFSSNATRIPIIRDP